MDIYIGESPIILDFDISQRGMHTYVPIYIPLNILQSGEVIYNDRATLIKAYHPQSEILTLTLNAKNGGASKIDGIVMFKGTLDGSYKN